MGDTFNKNIDLEPSLSSVVLLGGNIGRRELSKLSLRGLAALFAASAIDLIGEESDDPESIEKLKEIEALERKYSSEAEDGQQLDSIIPGASSSLGVKIKKLKDNIPALMEIIRTEQKELIEHVKAFLVKEIKGLGSSTKNAPLVESINLDLSTLMETKTQSKQYNFARELFVKYNIVMPPANKAVAGSGALTKDLRDVAKIVEEKGEGMMKSQGMALRGKFLIDLASNIKKVLGINKNTGPIEKIKGQELLFTTVNINKKTFTGERTEGEFNGVEYDQVGATDLDIDRDSTVTIQVGGGKPLRDLRIICFTEDWQKVLMPGGGTLPATEVIGKKPTSVGFYKNTVPFISPNSSTISCKIPKGKYHIEVHFTSGGGGDKQSIKVVR